MVLGTLVLEDGTVWKGRGFGAGGRAVGEVVFTTGMTGYQEVLTDPSYCGQIVTMTFPLIGNYGINPSDSESLRPSLRAFIVRQWCRHPSHWQAAANLDDFLRQSGICGLEGVDTRALTRHLRQHGTMRGVLVTGPRGTQPAESDTGRLAAQAASWRLPDLVAEVTASQVHTHSPGREGAAHVVVVDLGVKHSILRALADRGCRVTVHPAAATADELLRARPDLVLLSNGPGDPCRCRRAIEAARGLVGRVPLCGICLGHQVIALALGAATARLKFGHRGANHPVRDLATGRAFITSQNHGYTVRPEGLAGTGLMVTHTNLNDGTIEGLRHFDLPLQSVQFHPEGGPGPWDSRALFDAFLSLSPKAARHVGVEARGSSGDMPEEVPPCPGTCSSG